MIRNIFRLSYSRVVAKGPDSEGSTSKPGIFMPPKTNKDMPTLCPFILILLAQQGHPVLSIALEYTAMVLAFPWWALEAHIFLAYPCSLKFGPL